MTINGFNNSNPAQALIEQALAADRFPHTCIIEGGSYEERLALAEKAAAALLCEDENLRPCSKCSHCIKSKNGLHPDLAVYPPRTEKNTKKPAYAVKYVQEIRDEAFIIPNEANRKIIILSNAELLAAAGQNALLKILEEPPEFDYFILLSNSKSVFLETILSRASVFNIGETFQDESSEISPDDAIDAAIGIAEALRADNQFEIVKSAGIFDKNPALMKMSLAVLQEIFMLSLRMKFSDTEESDLSDAANALTSKFTKNALLKMIDSTTMLIKSFDYNANYNLTTARLCSLLKSSTSEQE